MKIGYIGLGRMGKNMVLRFLEQGIEVVAWNRSPKPLEEVKKAGAQTAASIDELISKLETPRTIWVMVTAGETVDLILKELAEKLEPGDLVIDGGNSFYKDSIRRAKVLAEKGIHFMDIGTSGGIKSAREGACLMIGGSKEDYKRIIYIAKAAAAPDAYGHLGPVGAGHFAKMVHNAIEYGMMEAIGEGAAVLKYSDFKYDLRSVFKVYSNTSIIQSRLVDWTLAEFNVDPTLSCISSVIGSGGAGKKVLAETHWTVREAKEKGIKVPVMEDSIKVRDESDKDIEDSPQGFRNKVVAAMRWQFGGHPVKK